MNPQQLKTIMGSGLLLFPLPDFDSNGAQAAEKAGASGEHSS